MYTITVVLSLFFGTHTIELGGFTGPKECEYYMNRITINKKLLSDFDYVKSVECIRKEN